MMQATVSVLDLIVIGLVVAALIVGGVYLWHVALTARARGGGGAGQP
jgi:hypothetical protein